MDRLIVHLLENLIIDFQGDLDLDMVREFLRGDESKEARAFLTKLLADGGVSEMMVVLGDCLKDFVPNGINADTVREQLRLYVES